MALQLNKAIIIGRLGADPEQKGQTGEIVTCTVATSDTWKDKSTGNKIERTQWHRVVVFAEQPRRYLAQYGKKGDLICVEGQIETRKWERGPDDNVYFTEIVVRPYSGSVQLLSQRAALDIDEEHRERREERREEPRPERKSQADLYKPEEKKPNIYDDEIPF